MIEFSEMCRRLNGIYTKDSNFFAYVDRKKYPYSISVTPPTSSELVNNISYVRKWQYTYESSALAPFLEFETKQMRVLGEQRILVKVTFPTREAFEGFINLKNKEEKFSSVEEVIAKGEQDLVKEYDKNQNEEACALTVQSIPGTFTCFDEICDKVLNPLVPNLEKGSNSYNLRMRGMRFFLSKKAKEVSLLGTDFVRAMQFVDYLASLEKTPNIFLRQFALENMDTKFIEKNYALINELLILCLPESRQLAFKQPNKSLLVNQMAHMGRRVSMGGNSINVGESVTINPEHDKIFKSKKEEIIPSTSLMRAPPSFVGIRNQNVLKEESNKEESNSTKINQLSTEYLPSLDENLSAFDRFLKRWGFKSKPDFVRIRILDEQLAQKCMGPLCSPDIDMQVDLEVLKNFSLDFKHIIVCENEVCFLSLPNISNTIAIFGAGYSVSHLSHLPMMFLKDVIYWGDVDTHGFAILNLLRNSLNHTLEYRRNAQRFRSNTESKTNDLQAAKQVRENVNVSIYSTPDFKENLKKQIDEVKASQKNDIDYENVEIRLRSILMDLPTLLNHKSLLVTEKSQSIGVLKYLERDEMLCYEALINNDVAQNARLEQELLPYSEVLEALSRALPEENIVVPHNYKF